MSPWLVVALAALASCVAGTPFHHDSLDGFRLFAVDAAGVPPSGCTQWKHNPHTRWLCCAPGVVPAGVRRVVHADVGEAIRAQRVARAAPDPRASPFFSAFRTEPEYVAQLQQWAAAYPTRVSLVPIGASVQNRTLWRLIIGAPPSSGNSGSAGAVLVTGLVHAREWLGGMTVMWLAEQLLVNATLQRGLEWHIVPMVNPDGYVFSWTGSGNRLWRKNRSAPPAGSACTGTDINRNFAFQWGVSGDSGDPCSDVYRGRAAGSEPETAALAAVMRALQPRLGLFVDVHSYLTTFTSVYGYATLLPPNYSALQRLMAAAQSAMRVNGLTYGTGTDAIAISPASGGTDDYAYSVGCNASFTLELRGDSFIAPVGDIALGGAEVTAGLAAVAALLRPAGAAVATRLATAAPIFVAALVAVLWQ